MSNDTKATPAKSNVATPARKKLSAKTTNLSKEQAGFTFKGKYMGLIKGTEFQQVDAKGEIVTKAMQFAIFENEAGERNMYTADKGLQDALMTALVKEGQTIEVVKCEKTSIGKGRSMNQYDIYQA